MKTTLNDLLQIDLNWLVKRRLIIKGEHLNSRITWSNGSGESKSNISISTKFTIDEKQMELNYTVNPNQENLKKSINYIIPLTSTKCNFGGTRLWFICPIYSSGRYCGRRVSKLYLENNYFCCRHCTGYLYESQYRNTKSQFYLLEILLDSDEKQSKLLNSIKKKNYKGLITKKYAKYLGYKSKVIKANEILEKLDIYK